MNVNNWRTIVSRKGENTIIQPKKSCVITKKYGTKYNICFDTNKCYNSFELKSSWCRTQSLVKICFLHCKRITL
jgi:hypothetical protein